MKTKLYLIIALVFGLAIIFFVGKKSTDKNTSTAVNEVLLNSNQSVNLKYPIVPVEASADKDSHNDLLSDSESETKSSDNALNDDEVDPSIGFIQSGAFLSSLAFNRAFVEDDGSINRHSLESVFLASDFANTIRAMREIPEEAEDSEYQAKLFTQLNQTLNSGYRSEEYSCRGGVCLVSFVYSNTLSEDDVSKIRDFGENYIFSNIGALNLQENTLRAVLIQTNDASSLTISN